MVEAKFVAKYGNRTGKCTFNTLRRGIVLIIPVELHGCLFRGAVIFTRKILRKKFSLRTFLPNFLFITGASVTQRSERSLFTSEAAGSILRENFLNVTQTQCSTHVKRVSQHSAESRGFSPGTPVSSHREVDRVG